MLQIFALVICPALLTVISLLYWELSKAKSRLRYLTNERMAYNRKALKTATPPTIYTQEALKDLHQKGLNFHYERLVADGCMRQAGFSHALLRDHGRSKIIELIFLDEIMPIISSSNQQLINALKKYEVENVEEKMN